MVEPAKTCKKVLVLLGPYSRVVELSGDGQLVNAIRNTFNDLPYVKNGILHVKIKNEEWHEFIDIEEEQLIPDHAVIQATVLPGIIVEKVCKANKWIIVWVSASQAWPDPRVDGGSGKLRIYIEVVSSSMAWVELEWGRALYGR